MLARCFIILCFTCLAAGCTSFSERFASEPIAKHLEPQRLQPIKQVRPVAAFTQIYIEGPFNVRLHTNKHKKQSLTIAGDAVDLSHIQSRVKGGVLYVSVGSRKSYIGNRELRMGEASLEINVPELHGFTYQGAGVITARHIHSNLLDIWLKNPKKSTFEGRINLRHLTISDNGTTKISGIHSTDLRINLTGAPKVELKGKANLRRLDMAGNGSLEFFWVNSTDLILRLSGASHLTLAGRVNRLDGVFTDHSHFNGRYLRVKEAFVKTEGKAVSDIAVVETQHALARGQSDIYYYNLPLLRTGFMAQNGSILDMRPEDLKLVQPHTIYNR
jgi:hypothetical protein